MTTWKQKKCSLGMVKYLITKEGECYVIQFGPQKWAWWFIVVDSMEETGEGGSVTSAKRMAQDCLDHSQGSLDFDECECECECETVEKVITYKTKEKRSKKDSISKELNMALWFINQVGDVGKAEKIFAAAIAATKALEEQ